MQIGTIKDRNGMDLREAEDIKRWQGYTEELYKKDLHPPDNHNGVITHLESDTTEHTRRSSMQKISKETGDWNNIKNYKQRWAQERTEMVWS